LTKELTRKQKASISVLKHWLEIYEFLSGKKFKNYITYSEVAYALGFLEDHGINIHSSGCAYCDIYDICNCKYCPIKKETEHSGCDGSPWIELRNTLNRYLTPSYKIKKIKEDVANELMFLMNVIIDQGILTPAKVVKVLEV